MTEPLNDIPTPIKIQIIDQDIQMYLNTRYQAQLRYRVQRSIGGTPDQLKVITDELTKIEAALDELNKAKDELKT